MTKDVVAREAAIAKGNRASENKRKRKRMETKD